MDRYLTRIELHNANPDGSDYTKLHKFMADADFYRVIPDYQGNIYELLTAEYYSTQQYSTAQSVKTLAIVAAMRTGLKFGVIVIKFQDASWEYLPLVQN